MYMFLHGSKKLIVTILCCNKICPIIKMKVKVILPVEVNLRVTAISFQLYFTPPSSKMP